VSVPSALGDPFVLETATAASELYSSILKATGITGRTVGGT